MADFICVGLLVTFWLSVQFYFGHLTFKAIKIKENIIASVEQDSEVANVQRVVRSNSFLTHHHEHHEHDSTPTRARIPHLHGTHRDLFAGIMHKDPLADQVSRLQVYGEKQDGTLPVRRRGAHVGDATMSRLRSTRIGIASGSQARHKLRRMPKGAGVVVPKQVRV
uniref:Uncharacterized protein n=1 Tax=Haptolina brevifila TaxID=156173 RepID=A0A7S2CCG3_9EUKA